MAIKSLVINVDELEAYIAGERNKEFEAEHPCIVSIPRTGTFKYWKLKLENMYP